MLEDRIESVKNDTPTNEEFEDKLGTMSSKVQSVSNELSAVQSDVKTLKSKDNVQRDEFQKGLEDFRREVNTDMSDLRDKISSQYATSKEVSSLWDALRSLEESQEEIGEIVDEIDDEGVSNFGKLKDTTKYLEHKIQDLESLEDKVENLSTLQERVSDLELIVEGIDEQNVSNEEVKELEEQLTNLSEMVKTLAQRTSKN